MFVQFQKMTASIAPACVWRCALAPAGILYNISSSMAELGNYLILWMMIVMLFCNVKRLILRGRLLFTRGPPLISN